MLGAVHVRPSRRSSRSSTPSSSWPSVRQGAVVAAGTPPELARARPAARRRGRGSAPGLSASTGSRTRTRQHRRDQRQVRRGTGRGGLRAGVVAKLVQGSGEARSCAAISCKTAGASTAATPETVRPISCEIGVLPRAHGSALFTRGETQALVVTTLGTGEDEQIIDALEGEYRENFMLHYNFPPYSVGEAGRLGSPGTARDRPRQARLARDPAAAAGQGQTSPTRSAWSREITESNGSSSMATVCGARCR